MLPCVIVYVLAFGMLSCATSNKTVYVPDGGVYRLAETLDNVDVWVNDDKGQEVKVNATLYEGWYCMADPGVE